MGFLHFLDATPFSSTEAKNPKVFFLSIVSEDCVLPCYWVKNQRFPCRSAWLWNQAQSQDLTAICCSSDQCLQFCILLYLNFSFPLRTQHPFSWHGLQFWGAENKWIFKMRKHHEVSSDRNLHSRVLPQKSCYPDVSRLYKFKLWSEQNSFIEWLWPIFYGLLFIL